MATHQLLARVNRVLSSPITSQSHD